MERSKKSFMIRFDTFVLSLRLSTGIIAPLLTVLERRLLRCQKGRCRIRGLSGIGRQSYRSFR